MIEHDCYRDQKGRIVLSQRTYHPGVEGSTLGLPSPDGDTITLYADGRPYMVYTPDGTSHYIEPPQAPLEENRPLGGTLLNGIPYQEDDVERHPLIEFIKNLPYKIIGGDRHERNKRSNDRSCRTRR